MLKRKYRLRHRHDINRVYKKGQTCHTKLLTARVLPNRLKHPRATVVVSTKVAKSAVKRNRMRRRLFAALAEQWPQLGAYDFIVTAKQDLSVTEADELKGQLTSCLHRLHVLHPKPLPRTKS